MTVACPVDHVVLRLPKEPVLWTEKRSQSKQLAAEFLENLRGMSETRRDRRRTQQGANTRALHVVRPKLCQMVERQANAFHEPEARPVTAT